MEPMYVICFYWEGERWSSNIGPTTTKDPSFRQLLQKTGNISLVLASCYVNNLYHGVKKNATRDFKFICFTNEPLGVNENIELRKFPMYTGSGVLPRLYMFAQEAGLGASQVLCLDLDVVIVGKLKVLMAYDGPFCTRAGFARGEEGLIDGDIMSFRAGPWIEEKIWTPFVTNVRSAVNLTKGRERFWIRHTMDKYADRWQDISPVCVQSYKRHIVRPGVIPIGTEIISCHGHPRPHQIKLVEVRKHWDLNRS